MNKQALCWTSSDIKDLSAKFSKIDKKLISLGLNLFSKPINLIKTSEADEAGAAYTREETIIFPKGRQTIDVVAHELFHILTQKDAKWVDSLYSLLKFTPMPSSLSIPHELAQKVIVNPDAVSTRHILEVTVKAKNSKLLVIPMVFSTISQRDITVETTPFFRYIDFKLLSLTTGEFFSPDETNYFDFIGKNTRYIIHPEEVLADNFAMMLFKDVSSFPNPEIPQKLIEFLRNK